jgi:tetratricopeptide (TPR) repeat protein
VRQWLEHHDGWLLILDNASEPAAIYPYLPRTPHGHLIITSRNLGWGGTARALTVPVLPREASVVLLLQCTQQTDADAARAVAETLGDLPLALAQAAAYIDATGLSLAAYGERLQARLTEVLRRGEVGPEYPATVATTWAFALQAVQETHPAAISLLRLCAFFAPDALPHALVRHDTSSLPEALGTMVSDDLTWDEALAVLRRYALMEVEGDTLAMHRLVQAVTRAQLSTEERMVWARVAVAQVANTFPGEASEPQTWATCARLLPHAVVALTHLDATHTEPAVTTYLLNAIGNYLYARGQWEEATPYWERALAMREAVLGAQHPDVATSLNNLALLYHDQGHYEEAEKLEARAQTMDPRAHLRRNLRFRPPENSWRLYEPDFDFLDEFFGRFLTPNSLLSEP